MTTGYRRSDGAGPAQLAAMQALASRLWSWSSRWHPGELAWFWCEHGRPDPSWRLAHWRHGDRVVAWAWARAGRLDLQLDPAHLALTERIVAWSGATSVTVLDAETALAADLARHGYLRQDDARFFAHLRRPLAGLPDVPTLPNGYTLRPVAGPADAAARAAVHAAAFDVTMTEAGYRGVMRAPSYRPELDWLVLAPDGTPAASALAWVDGEIAVLEPVGTDPRHRRRGLAAAATLAALSAASDLGAKHARVCARGDDGYPAARAAYEALGFRAYARNVRLARPG
ncbi:GNAT family N-acetyltransferase [Jiangella alkaliphila]|uniref:Acetyltransferase (GNAT) family protein n=1 Tax=Jiangella alkaliphila TaxID=419479 RepID=A0A1H2LYB9_9ACTN|nr:GNAT family N-acetyltransferase [Jiangella alkaliphila]SDU85884.1 Acetyltransferase (GNAT) family protein [Jiangella alkaliphila]